MYIPIVPKTKIAVPTPPMIQNARRVAWQAAALSSFLLFWFKLDLSKIWSQGQNGRFKGMKRDGHIAIHRPTRGIMGNFLSVISNHFNKVYSMENGRSNFWLFKWMTVHFHILDPSIWEVRKWIKNLKFGSKMRSLNRNLRPILTSELQLSPSLQQIDSLWSVILNIENYIEIAFVNLDEF